MRSVCGTGRRGPRECTAAGQTSGGREIGGRKSGRPGPTVARQLLAAEALGLKARAIEGDINSIGVVVRTLEGKRMKAASWIGGQRLYLVNTHMVGAFDAAVLGSAGQFDRLILELSEVDSWSFRHI